MAQGQANRAQEIKRALHDWRTLTLQQFPDGAPIRLSALVTLEADDGAVRVVFIGPQEGGLKLQVQGIDIMVITPGSPLGGELIGKCSGDEVRSGKTCYQVLEVS